MNVAREILEWFEQVTWQQENLVTREGNKAGAPITHTCLAGAASQVVSGDVYAKGPTMMQNLREGVVDIAATIKELFPDRVACPGRAWNFDPEGGYESPISTVVRFNDHTDTTFDDVKLVLEKTATKLEEKVE